MSHRPAKLSVGFTIAELLIALAITGLLLAAMAVVFNASVMGYQENVDIFKTINNARQALSRITTQVRTAEAIAIDPCSPDSECTLVTSGGDNITYRYNNADNKLYLTSDSDYLLCDNVTAMTFIKYTAIDEDGQTYCKSVQVSMTVSNGNAEKTIAAAAVVRRNLQYTDAD